MIVIVSIVVSGAVAIHRRSGESRTHGAEVLLVDFRDGIKGATTSNRYSGEVEITLSGIGQAAGSQYSDAFYIFTDESGSEGNPPRYSERHSVWIDGVPVEVWGDLPEFSSLHTYTIRISVENNFVRVGVGDAYTIDNSGFLDVEVSGAAASRPSDESSSLWDEILNRISEPAPTNLVNVIFRAADVVNCAYAVASLLRPRDVESLASGSALGYAISACGDTVEGAINDVISAFD